VQTRISKERLQAGFGLTESLIGVVVIGVVFTALYTGMTTGFQAVRSARENLRATQIMLEKFEALRLYNWDQITSTNGYVPTSFTNHYVLNPTTAGTVFYGDVRIEPLPVDPIEPYREDLRAITITLRWNSGNNNPRTRTFTSYVAKYGLQNYVYTGN
jgi:prepilin-type N-terminal cleavage/methylation domain-containing protein